MEEVNFNDLVSYVIQDNHILLIDFYSPQCGPCKILAPILERESKRYPSVKFIKIDVTKPENQIRDGISKAANITTVPTVVIYQQGIEKFRHPGILDPITLETILKEKFDIIAQ